MRVLQFGKFYPPNVGGIETVIEDLTLALNANGNQRYIIHISNIIGCVEYCI